MNRTLCKGCYKEGYADYCLPCRRALFSGVNMPCVLSIQPFSSGGKAAAYQHINKISISGVQIKFSLSQQGKLLNLTNRNATHLLKPIPYGPFDNLNEAPANEHLTMQIAAQVFKIPTAANGLVYFENSDELAYVTRRFDVLPGGAKNLQEDFAQLTGKTEENAGKNYKYSGSYYDIAKLMKSLIAAYKPMAEQFFKLVLFNYMFSNGDAHLKNFSLVQTPAADYILSPAYDLMCTVLHTPGESDLAMEDGLFEGDMESPGYATFGSYTRLEFQKFADMIGVIPKRSKQVMDQYQTVSDAVVTLVKKSFLSAQAQDAYLGCYQNKLRCFNSVLHQ